MSSDLCEELIVEIFSRLPAKSLVRFRTVSKALNRCICSPEFIRLHTSRSPKKFTILHQNHYRGDPVAKIMYTIHSEAQLSSYADITPVEYPFGTIRRIVGSCGGIVCVYDDVMRAIHLWNPSIRRKATVHELPSWAPTPAWGFCFDPIINDYKILRISEAGTFVYSMKTSTWREIASPAFPPANVNSSQCLFNGILHWVAVAHSSYVYYNFLMTFDWSSEVFSVIELPRPHWRTSHVTIIEGCLAVISSENTYLSWIWVRNTVGSWSVAIITNDAHQYWSSAHLDLLISRNTRGIEIYDPKTGMRSRLGRLRDSLFYYILDVITCTESLALLDMGTSCDLTEQTILSKRKREAEAAAL